MSSVPCVHCVAYGSLETDLKSVFIGLRAVSKLSYATHATQRTHGVRRNQKLKYTTHARKKQRTQSILFVALRFSCEYSACIASVALRTTAWKPTFKPVFCILMAAALFRRRSARVGQTAIAKFLFMMDEQFVKFDDRRWSGYNYQSARIKQMDASVSERVCGGLTCRSPGSNVGLC